MYVVIAGQSYSNGEVDVTKINYKSTITDPMALAVFTVGDANRSYGFTDYQSVVLIDESGLSSPTHTLLVDPSMVSIPVVTAWATDNTAGGNITNLNPGW